MRLAVAQDLDAPCAVVQVGHVMALAGAVDTRPAQSWECTTLVAHGAPIGLLCELIRRAGGHPARTGAASGVAWFCEPDLLHAPTALVVLESAPPSLVARIAGLDLYEPESQPPRYSRLWLRRLAADAERAGLGAVALWDEAQTFGDPAELDVRVRTAHLFCRGREPPC